MLRALRGIGRILHWIIEAGSPIGMCGLVIMLLIINIEVLARKLLNTSTGVSDEVSAYMLVLVFYMGVGLTMKEGRHIQLETVVTKLSPRWRRRLGIGWSILGIIFVALLLYESFIYALKSFYMDSVSISILFTPLYIPQSIIPIGLLLLLSQLITDLVLAIKASRPIGRN